MGRFDERVIRKTAISNMLQTSLISDACSWLRWVLEKARIRQDMKMVPAPRVELGTY